ncbi:MAG: hypothetical protein GW761_00145, partial [Leptospira sp.]|nr:hypothetical protein [Leptospira sp.]
MRGKKATASNYNKYYSRRFLITLWAVGLTTTIVLYSLVSQYEAQWVGITLPLLIAM